MYIMLFKPISVPNMFPYVRTYVVKTISFPNVSIFSKINQKLCISQLFQLFDAFQTMADTFPTTVHSLEKLGKAPRFLIHCTPCFSKPLIFLTFQYFRNYDDKNISFHSFSNYFSNVNPKNWYFVSFPSF